MTDKEFKRLSRSQLIDIIYQLQLKQETLIAENDRLSNALADRRIRIEHAGSIAEAAFALHDVIQAAQDAADHYLEEIQTQQVKAEQELNEAREQAAATLEKAQKEADAILKKAQKEADTIITRAKTREARLRSYY